MRVFRVAGVFAVVALLAICGDAARAQAAPRPLRVLAPEPSGDELDMANLVGSFLKRRLGTCSQVELVEGERGRRVGAYVCSRAFDYTDEQRWLAFRNLVAADAVILVSEIGAPYTPAGGCLEIVILREGAVKRIEQPYDVSEASVRQRPEFVADVARRVGESMGLPEQDVARLAEVRVADPVAQLAVERAHLFPVMTNSMTFSAMAVALNPPDGEPRDVEQHLGALNVATVTLTTHMDRPFGPLQERVYALGRAAVFDLIGTPHEEACYALATMQPENPELLTDVIAETGAMLREVAGPLKFGDTIGGQVEEIEALAELEDMLDDAMAEERVTTTPNLTSSLVGQTAFSTEQRLGALRMLGMMADADAMPLLEKTAWRADAKVRRATAFALGGFADDNGLELLNAMQKDKDAGVAFAAAYSLWRRGRAPQGTGKTARAMLQHEGIERRWAARILAAESSDVAILRQLVGDAIQDVRDTARRRLAAVEKPDAERLLAQLSSPDQAVVIAAIRQLPASPDESLVNAVMQRTSDVSPDVAWAARDALANRRPGTPREATRFDIATAHIFVRQRSVRALATSTEPWATDELVVACSNADPHTRVAALRALVARDSKAAHRSLGHALSDPHRLMRLNAAALLAECAAPGDADVIRSAIPHVKDKATQLYLADALARATGQPLPPAQPAARSVAGKRNLAWLCGAGDVGRGEGALTSPYDAYYMLDVKVDDGWRRAYEQTRKIYIGRATPIGDPGPIMVDPVTQDAFWLALDAELTDDRWPWLDGVLYGEESMSMSTTACWDDAWRVFCDDAGIDRATINGDIGKLTEPQRQAFTAWGMRRSVEGFNRLYDYTRLKYGKLKPGFQVATFLGEQGLWEGPNVADFDWKFDIGGVYQYFGDSRKTAYALVRRYQTIWPDRPVLWLSHGIGVYERTPIKYDHKAPLEPIRDRYRRCYLDAATSYLAGADTGWFSIWGFMARDYGQGGGGGGLAGFKGPIVTPEDIRIESPEPLQRGIDFSFEGVVDMLATNDEIEAVHTAQPELPIDPKEAQLRAEFDSLTETPAGIKRAVEVDDAKRQMFIGFHYYRRFLYDIARLFAALPRNRYHADALVIHPVQNVWYGSLDSPGGNLPNQFDFFIDINKVQHIDLSRYRFICVQDPQWLEDGTIDSISGWIRDVPGLLYVHRDLTADNARERGTVSDHDGSLANDWPWEQDVQLSTDKVSIASDAPFVVDTPDGPITMKGETTARTYVVKEADHIKVLGKMNGKPVVVLWRDPKGKGAVLFDGIDRPTLDHMTWLRDRLHELADGAKGPAVGRRFEYGIRHLRIDRDDIAVAVSNHAPEYGPPLPGVEAMTGEINPRNWDWTYASIVIRKLRGEHVAADNGITIIAEQPIERFDSTGSGVIVQTGGTFRAVSTTGVIDVAPVEGELPPVIGATAFNDWLIFKTTPGIAPAPSKSPDDPRRYLYFIRATGPVELRPGSAPTNN